MLVVFNRFLVTALTLTLVLGACGGDEPAADTGSGPGGPKDQVSLLLPFTHSVDFAHYYMAEDQGFFDQCGIDLSFKSAANVPNPAQLVVAQAVDYAIIDPLSYISGVHRDLPLIALSQDTGRTGVSFFSLKKTGIESPEDLPGHVVGLNPGDDNLWFLEKIMSDYLSPEERDQVKIVPASFSINPLLSGVVDVYGTWIDDPATIVAEEKGEPLNAIISYDYGIRTAGNLLVTNKEKLTSDADVTKRFLAAVSAGLEEATAPENADEAVDASLARMEEAPSREVMMKVYEYWVGMQESPLYDDKGVGWHDPAAYEQTQQFLMDNGKVSEALPVEELYTTEILEQVFTDGKVDLDEACG